VAEVLSFERSEESFLMLKGVPIRIEH